METTTETFESYLVPDAGQVIVFPPELVEKVNLRPYVPELVQPDLGLPRPGGDPWPEVFQTLPDDVLIGPSTGVLFGDRVLGPRGSVAISVTAVTGSPHLVGPALERVVATDQPGSFDRTGITDVTGVNEVFGSDLEPTAIATIHPEALADAGLSAATTHVTVVGASGLSDHAFDRPDLRLAGGLLNRFDR